MYVSNREKSSAPSESLPKAGCYVCAGAPQEGSRCHGPSAFARAQGARTAPRQRRGRHRRKEIKRHALGKALGLRDQEGVLGLAQFKRKCMAQSYGNKGGQGNFPKFSRIP